VEARGWEDARLNVLVLQALTLQAQGEANQAVSLLVDALALAEPGGFVRVFVDEGPPVSRLLSAVAPVAKMPDYIGKLVAICQAEARRSEAADDIPARAQSLVEPLSRREEEVLQLIAKGLSNQEIAGRLVLAVVTVKGHNKRIFGKLQVQRRTEAVARARELGLL
jgi:LuxR family maltose regulon positive regulatory protein